MVTLDLDELEECHLKDAVLAHYARTLLANVEPGSVGVSDVNREAAQSLYRKVETATRG
jgi:hypothetical protein